MQNSNSKDRTNAQQSIEAEVTTSRSHNAKPHVIGSCWSFKCYTSAIADTGDYDSNVQFTNGKDTLQSCGDEIEDEQCKQFCELLDLMPDLWSHKCDNAEFELSQAKKKNEFLEKQLKVIRDAFYTDGETDKEKVEDLKAIAFNAIYEIEKGLF